MYTHTHIYTHPRTQSQTRARGHEEVFVPITCGFTCFAYFMYYTTKKHLHPFTGIPWLQTVLKKQSRAATKGSLMTFHKRLLHSEAKCLQYRREDSGIRHLHAKVSQPKIDNGKSRRRKQCLICAHCPCVMLQTRPNRKI